MCLDTKKKSLKHFKMTKRKRKGYLVTALVLAATTVIAAFNSDKIKEFVNSKFPSIGEMLTFK